MPQSWLEYKTDLTCYRLVAFMNVHAHTCCSEWSVSTRTLSGIAKVWLKKYSLNRWAVSGHTVWTTGGDMTSELKIYFLLHFLSDSKFFIKFTEDLALLLLTALYIFYFLK